MAEAAFTFEELSRSCQFNDSDQALHDVVTAFRIERNQLDQFNSEIASFNSQHM